MLTSIASIAALPRTYEAGRLRGHLAYDLRAEVRVEQLFKRLTQLQLGSQATVAVAVPD